MCYTAPSETTPSMLSGVTTLSTATPGTMLCKAPPVTTASTAAPAPTRWWVALATTPMSSTMPAMS